MEHHRVRVERRVILGIDLAKKVDRTCVCITEQRGDEFWCRDLGRYPAGLDYGEQSRRIGRDYHRTAAYLTTIMVREAAAAGDYTLREPYMDPPPEIDAASRVWVLIDASGVGEAVVDGVREHCGIPDNHVLGIQITGGTGHDFRLGATSGSVSKQYLISQLRRLTGFEPPLLKLPHTRESKALRDELEVFQYNITDSAHPQFGARQGKHDDMILSLALSTLPGALPVYRAGAVRYA